MRIAVLGSGMVGKAIASGLVQAGHEVRMGSRAPGNANATAWASETGERASQGTFADAAAFGEAVFNCTAGAHSLEALTAAGQERLVGKLLVDVANPLDRSGGTLPTLSICNTDSLGERIQEAFPAARVVKTLNTISADVMTNPAKVPGEHVIFICGNDATAKTQATRILDQLGWPVTRVVDLGDITAARGTEMYVPLWLRLWNALGTPHFNLAVTR